MGVNPDHDSDRCINCAIARVLERRYDLHNRLITPTEWKEFMSDLGDAVGYMMALFTPVDADMAFYSHVRASLEAERLNMGSLTPGEGEAVN